MPTVLQAIENLQARWDVSPAGSREEPIFILSAGWRSGSTMLQRLVLSDPDVLIWGEPYAHCDLVRRLADSLCAFNENYPRDDFLIREYTTDSDSRGKLSDLWVANLYPMPTDLIEAHRRFFMTMFQEPAKQLGYSRWGFKEVRLSAAYARYLKLLFPAARFLFLCRNPYSAYRSYRTFRAWYDKWPSPPVFTARQFGSVWRSLTESFMENYIQIGGRFIRHEDLVTGHLNVAELKQYLGLDTNVSKVERTIEGVRIEKPRQLSYLEHRMLASVVEPLASRLNYEPN